MKGLYEQSNKIARSMLAEGQAILKVSEIEKHLDASHMTREELERIAKNRAAIDACCKNNCRSVIYGEGYYANIDMIRDPHVITKLLSNVETTAEDRSYLIKTLQDALDGVTEFSEHAQCRFTIGDDGNLTIIQELTVEDMKQLLETLSGQVA